jgi:hypothetical protein
MYLHAHGPFSVIHKHTHTYVPRTICTYIYVLRLDTYVHKHIHMCALCTDMYTCVHTITHTRTHTWARTATRIYVYKLWLYTHIYTHTNTYSSHVVPSLSLEPGQQHKHYICLCTYVSNIIYVCVHMYHMYHMYTCECTYTHTQTHTHTHTHTHKPCST